MNTFDLENRTILRPRQHVSLYFFNPQLFESALQSGNFWIRYIRNRVNAKSEYFLSGDVTRSSPVLYREYCIQHDNLAPKFSLLPVFTTHALLPNPRGVLGTRMNPDTCRIRVDGQIRFENGYVWMWKFKNAEKKARIKKYPDTCGWGLPCLLYTSPSPRD